MSKLRQAEHVQAPLAFWTALCRTSTFQNSYFVRIIKLWNYVCKSAPPNCYDTLSNFKTYLHKTYLHLTATAHTLDLPQVDLKGNASSERERRSRSREADLSYLQRAIF
jgi:hypothetical protein